MMEVMKLGEETNREKEVQTVPSIGEEHVGVEHAVTKAQEQEQVTIEVQADVVEEKGSRFLHSQLEADTNAAANVADVADASEPTTELSQITITDHEPSQYPDDDMKYGIRSYHHNIIQNAKATNAKSNANPANVQSMITFPTPISNLILNHRKDDNNNNNNHGDEEQVQERKQKKARMMEVFDDSVTDELKPRSRSAPDLSLLRLFQEEYAKEQQQEQQQEQQAKNNSVSPLQDSVVAPADHLMDLDDVLQSTIYAPGVEESDAIVNVTIPQNVAKQANRVNGAISNSSSHNSSQKLTQKNSGSALFSPVASPLRTSAVTDRAPVGLAAIFDKPLQEENQKFLESQQGTAAITASSDDSIRSLDEINILQSQPIVSHETMINMNAPRTIESAPMLGGGQSQQTTIRPTTTKTRNLQQRMFGQSKARSEDLHLNSKHKAAMQQMLTKQDLKPHATFAEQTKDPSNIGEPSKSKTYSRDNSSTSSSVKQEIQRTVSKVTQSILPKEEEMQFPEEKEVVERVKTVSKADRENTMANHVTREPPIYGIERGQSPFHDLWALIHNSIRVEIRDLFIILDSLKGRRLDLSIKDFAEFFDWYWIFKRFVLQALITEEKLFVYVDKHAKLPMSFDMDMREEQRRKVIDAMSELDDLGEEFISGLVAFSNESQIFETIENIALLLLAHMNLIDNIVPNHMRTNIPLNPKETQKLERELIKSMISAPTQEAYYLIERANRFDKQTLAQQVKPLDKIACRIKRHRYVHHVEIVREYGVKLAEYTKRYGKVTNSRGNSKKVHTELAPGGVAEILIEATP
mmetsp:Transcript_13941/g.23793  ORF Transcript_13941/g.23793 Transcript_13941/m.23793 type:complete len:808 (-) Transcript_13941:140-2563(-)